MAPFSNTGGWPNFQPKVEGLGRAHPPHPLRTLNGIQCFSCVSVLNETFGKGLLTVFRSQMVHFQEFGFTKYSTSQHFMMAGGREQELNFTVADMDIIRVLECPGVSMTRSGTCSKKFTSCLASYLFDDRQWGVTSSWRLIVH